MKNGARGGTLTEMMVATAILSIAVMGLMGAFVGIQKAIQGGKSTTLAANLAQEQMQILKQKVYYQILITTNPAYDTNFTPNVEYDPGYFAPTTVLEGGIYYTRYTKVEVAREDSGAIVILPPTTPDTGLKLVTVTTVWKNLAEYKKLELRTIVANPDTVTANAIFNGTVKNATTLVGISGAIVNMAENLGWRDTSNGSGIYSINASPGNFTLGVTVPGYFPDHRSVSIAANQTQVQDFNLVPMSSGSATSAVPVWLAQTPVISQIIVSSAQYDANNFELQAVELYNPSPNAIVVGSGSTPNALKLKLQSGCSGANFVTCAGTTYGIKLNYTNTTLPSRGYYLIANKSTFTLNGISYTADAVYADDANSFCNNPPLASNWNLVSTPQVKKLGPTGHGGVFFITSSSDTVYDGVGWSHTSGGVNFQPYCETSCLAQDGGQAGDQFVRAVSTYTTSALFATYGRAYDSNQNRVDFTTSSGVQYPVYTSVTAPKLNLAGTVPTGAVVSATDGLSLSTRVYTTGNPPVARFNLTQIATGTWTMLVSSGSWMIQYDTVSVPSSGSVFTLPSTVSFLSTSNTFGFIEGQVTNVLGAAINPAIPLDPGGAGSVVYANTTNGEYLLRVLPGSVDVIANSGAGSSANYITVSSLAINVNLGEIHTGVDFALSQGGRISGFVTRDGTNPLPGVAVSILDSNGYSHDTQVSGSNGYFTTLNIATGTYDVDLALDSIENQSPLNVSATVVPGGNTFSSTFTVTGALGAITGNVTLSGAPLKTGALIVVTTVTLAGSPPAPPALSSANLVGSPYYIASSLEDGSYHVDVRQSTSTTYRVYAYYTTYSGATPTINSLVITGVGVLSGQTVSGQNFAW